MKHGDQLYVADVLQAYREELAEIANELASRGEPISQLEARLLLELAEGRLVPVESALRHDYQRSVSKHRYLASRHMRLRRILARVRSWARPRIGNLRHYEPRPLTVPARYLREALPHRTPLISIVTPSFQQGRFLDRTLYSVVSQHYPALEYIVQDGGSSDETVSVLRRFEALLTDWKSEPDGGQGDAINRGFARTTGEIMAWLNSDDLLLPGSLAYVARYFAEHPDVDVIYGNRIMIDENDGQIGAWILPGHDDLALTLADYVPQETLFWRRRIWDAAAGAVDPSFCFALDWDLLLRFRAAGAKMRHLPRFLGAFRVHPEQKTTVADAVGFDECNRLREFVHGRQMSIDEVLQRLRPYFLRHILVHSRQRALDRLPLRPAYVVTVPTESALRRPDRERRDEEAQSSERATVVSPLVPLEEGFADAERA